MAMKFLKGTDGHSCTELLNASRGEPAPQLITGRGEYTCCPSRKMNWLFQDVATPNKVIKHK
jgi:hypothetical protein